MPDTPSCYVYLDNPCCCAYFNNRLPTTVKTFASRRNLRYLLAVQILDDKRSTINRKRGYCSVLKRHDMFVQLSDLPGAFSRVQWLVGRLFVLFVASGGDAGKPV